MPLAERQRLFHTYRAAAQTYCGTVANFDEGAFHDALQRTELARGEVETARAALLKNEHLNVAFIGPKTEEVAPHRVAVIGSTVALFNVSKERWDLFEIAVCGAPPGGALAYAPSPGPERGQWIVDAQDMNDCEKRNLKLYFTEAGLNILREAGLEM